MTRVVGHISSIAAGYAKVGNQVYKLSGDYERDARAAGLGTEYAFDIEGGTITKMVPTGKKIEPSKKDAEKPKSKPEPIAPPTGSPAAAVTGPDPQGDASILGTPSVVEVRHYHIKDPEYQDSIEIGTPGKGGVLKVRFNAGDEEEAGRLVRAAYRMLVLGRELMASGEAPQTVAPTMDQLGVLKL